MTRIVLLALLLVLLLLAVAGWTVRGARWVAAAPARGRRSAGRPLGMTAAPTG